MFGGFGDSVGTAIPGGVTTVYYTPVNTPTPRLSAARAQNEELATRLAAKQAQVAALRDQPSGPPVWLKVALVAGLGYLVITGVRAH